MCSPSSALQLQFAQTVLQNSVCSKATVNRCVFVYPVVIACPLRSAANGMLVDMR